MYICIDNTHTVSESLSVVFDYYRPGKNTYTAGTKLSICLVLLSAFANQYSEIMCLKGFIMICNSEVTIL